MFKIKLQGMGEPTIHKQFFEMIKYANQNGISVEFTTNGSLISDEKINQLYKLNISQINISIDGYTKKTFEKIRVNSNFEKVIENSRNLINKMKSKLLAPKIIAWTVVQNDNFEEILDIYKLCNKLGFDEIVFQFHISDWGKKEWLAINSKKDKRNEILSIQKKLELLKKREKFKFKIFKENILNFKKQCSWPWDSLYLDSKGFVTPCCIIGDSNVKNFGNIQEKKFIEIYNSNEYAEFRNQIKNNKIPEFCKNCYSEFRKN